MPPELYDIVVIGAGPAGLLLSTSLARWGYRVKNIDNRERPTPTGRADGIQPRSLDLLRNMGLKSAIMAHKPARVYEVAFWEPGERGIRRTGTWASCPDFIDARYPFTTLLHQGLVERVFIKDLAANGVSVQRPWTIDDFSTHSPIKPTHPVTIHTSHITNKNLHQTLHAKYLFSGEGARSTIRESLNIPMHYTDSATHTWAVMDGLVRTTFPDIRMKCTIHSEAGSVMVIPRERNLVRLYIQLSSSSSIDARGYWDPRKTASVPEVQEAAQRIFAPYWLAWETVEWFSVYPIGQGIAERYTLDNRVLLGGDACHTHSPKAGQGMNTAFLDAQNLAWKIHHVEAGFAQREVLLQTYEEERKKVAEDLLEFDERYARLFSARVPAAAAAARGREGRGNANTTGTAEDEDEDEAKDTESKTLTQPNPNPSSVTDTNPFIRTFKESCSFTSGYGVSYPSNILNYSSTHPAASSPSSHLFLTHEQGTTLLHTGRIFPPATVTRVTDANPVHLEQEIPSNGAFRVLIYAGRPVAPPRPHLTSSQEDSSASPTPKQPLTDLANHLLRPHSFLSSHLRRDVADPALFHAKDCLHSRMVTFCVIFDAQRKDVDVDGMVPAVLARYRDRVYADDLVGGGGGRGAYGKVRIRGGLGRRGRDVGGDGDGEGKGVRSNEDDDDDDEGFVVVVRPDGYVGCVVRLVEGSGTVDALDAYFGGFVVGVGGGGGDEDKQSRRVGRAQL